MTTFPAGSTVAHKRHHEPYRKYCSPEGVALIAAMGGNAADIDGTIDADGNVRANHWGRPLLHERFRDPEGHIGRMRTIESMTAPEVDRLVGPNGERIAYMHEVFDAAARHGVTVFLEAKPDRRFTNPDTWRKLKAHADNAGAQLVAMCQPHDGFGIDVLAAAKVAGVPTLLLTRGRVPATWWRHLDAVKGRRAWTNPGRPAGVRRLGAGAKDATAWGCSCSTTRASIRAARIAIAKAAPVAHPPNKKEPTPVSKVQIYPGADAKAQWHADDHPGRKIDVVRGVIHTTETTDFPDYDGGATAPNLTPKPNIAARRLRIRQHFPIDMSSRSLKNLAGGVETNTLDVVQIELVGTCDPQNRRSWKGQGKLLAGRDYIYWPDAPDWALRELAKVLSWLHTEHGIPLKGPKDWVAYPDSYGLHTKQRFTNAEWVAFKGFCGHQHVAENDHGDPGNIAFAKVLEYAGGKPAPAPAPSRGKTPNITAFREAKTSAAKREALGRLIAGSADDTSKQLARDLLQLDAKTAATRKALLAREVR